MQAAIRFLLTLFIGVAGCSAMPVNNYSSVDKWDNPDLYEVDSSAYPTFRISKSVFDPPHGMVKGRLDMEPTSEILTDDVWHVTHNYGEYRYIFSMQYQTRQVNLIKQSYPWMKESSDYYLYHLPIDKYGKVVGGWIPFKNKKQVFLSSERKLVMDPSYWRNPEWEGKPSFIEQVK